MLATFVALSLALAASVSAQDPAVAADPAAAATLAPAPAAAAAAGVYVPGDADLIPGVQLVTLGAGADGYTAYEINGIVFAENAGQVIMTSAGDQGNVVYDCQLGSDAQATCNVAQQYDGGVTYAYTEPITYFGGALPSATTVDDPAAPANSTSSTLLESASDSALSTSAIVAAVTSSPSASRASSSSSAPTSMITTTRPAAVGPQANQVQSTSENIFGATATGSTSGAGRSGIISVSAVGAVAVLMGAALV